MKYFILAIFWSLFASAEYTLDNNGYHVGYGAGGNYSREVRPNEFGITPYVGDPEGKPRAGFPGGVSYINTVDPVVRYIDDQLPKILDECLQKICVTGTEREIVQKILKYRQQLIKKIIFFAYNDNSHRHSGPGNFFDGLRRLKAEGYQPTNLFRSADSSLERHAISTTGPGYIFININKASELSFTELMVLLIHEYGHQVGYRDDQHRILDTMAIKVVQSQKDKIIEKESQNFKVFIHNKSTAQEPAIHNINKYSFEANKVLPMMFIYSKVQAIDLASQLRRMLLPYQESPYSSANKKSDQRIGSAWVYSVVLRESSDRLKINVNLAQKYQEHSTQQKEKTVINHLKFEFAIKEYQLRRYPIKHTWLRMKNKNSVGYRVIRKLGSLNFERERIKLTKVDMPQKVFPGKTATIKVEIEGENLSQILKAKPRISLNFSLKEDSKVLAPLAPHFSIPVSSYKMNTYNKATLVFAHNFHYVHSQVKFNLEHLSIEADKTSLDLYPKYAQSFMVEGQKLPKIKLHKTGISFFNFTWFEYTGRTHYNHFDEAIVNCNTGHGYSHFRYNDDDHLFFKIKLTLDKPRARILTDQLLFNFYFRDKEISDGYAFQRVYNKKTLPYKAEIKSDPSDRTKQILEVIFNGKNLPRISKKDERDFFRPDIWFYIHSLHLQTEGSEGGAFYFCL